MQKGKWKDAVGIIEYQIEREKQVELVIEVKDNVYTAFIDGNLISEYYSKQLTEGSISLGMYYEEVDKDRGYFKPITFDDVTVTALK